MLNFKKIFISILLFCSLLLGQSLINGYGLGLKNNIYDSASLSVSSTGLIPSYNQNISLQNPSTWQNLGYTYFTGSYQSDFYQVLSNINNEYSALGSIQFIIPIKNKYSFGFGVSPYYDQYLELEGDDKIDFVAYNDTLSTYHSYSKYGGISAFSISGGGQIVENLNVALQLNVLYGSSRQETIFTLDDLDYYSQQRYVFNGSLAKIFINSDILTKYKIPLNMYFSYGFPLKSLSVKSYIYPPYEDTNGSGSQDFYDFPSTENAASPTEEIFKKISSTNEFQIGFDYKLDNGVSLLGEVSNWNEKEEYGASHSKLNDQVTSINHYSIGIVKFSPELIKNPFDRFNFKLGTYYKDIELLNSEKMIKEYGVSTGVSFNFGITKNQIDFAYSYGKRQGLIGIGDEKIQRFSVGITVGDVWFVKRRAQ